MTTARRLRELLARPGIIKTLAPHDVFTARLLEQAGCEMLFLGGFGVSASDPTSSLPRLLMTYSTIPLLMFGWPEARLQRIGSPEVTLSWMNASAGTEIAMATMVIAAGHVFLMISPPPAGGRDELRIGWYRFSPDYRRKPCGEFLHWYHLGERLAVGQL